MAKIRSVHICQSCGHQTPKWLGKCPECSGWNTFVEEKTKSTSGRRVQTPGKRPPEIQAITEVEALSESRLSTGIGELDRTLGGGLVAGSLVLIGGDPGIGKSTLMLQGVGGMAQKGRRVLYVSGEESPSQIKLRAERLGVLSENLLISQEICIEDLLELLDKVQPELVVLDSVQTFYTNEIPSAPGSIGQVREVAFKIFQYVKQRSLAALLIGHITKDGAIAGPKSLEHIVDTVVYFEGDSSHAFRILRAVKNRFGSTPEIGVFEMLPEGLIPVENPSRIFLSERPIDAPGSVIVCSLEGSRPLLIEVQALVTASSSVGMPRRNATGIDPNRMTLLVAIMEKRLGLQLQGEDIFVNIAGGIKISEPAIDLGMAAAIASSFKNQEIDRGTVMIGEIGLTGEVRSVNQLEPRIREAERLGFNRCVLPHSARQGKAPLKSTMDLQFVKTLDESFDIIF